MAKELEKFKAEHKKLAADTKKYSEAEGSKIVKRIKIAASSAWEGEDFFRESLAAARADGVSSDKPADLKKSKHFKEGLSAWKKAADMLQEDVDAVTAFSDDAAAHVKKMEALAASIAKDLKKRAKSSSSKKDIEAMQAALAKEIADVKKAAASEGKLNKMQKNYAADLDKTMAKILKEAPDDHSKQKDATELPQLLVDRNLKKYTNQVAGLVKAINAHCTTAVDKAADDLKAAAPELKSALEKYKDLKKINDQYQEVKKKFPGAIQDSKDKTKLLAALKKFDDLTAAAERKVRGTTATIKKAMA